MEIEYREATHFSDTHRQKENVKFYTEKCGFYIVSTERDGDVTHARFVLER